jgi:hypothetical protein
MCGTMVGSLWLNWITSGRFSAPVIASVRGHAPVPQARDRCAARRH